jgi:hypothetical protein
LYLATWIDYIRFADSMIVVKKRRNAKTTPFRRVMSGVVVSPGMLPDGDEGTVGESPPGSEPAGGHKRNAASGLGAARRIQLMQELGFYQNMQDLSEPAFTRTYPYRTGNAEDLAVHVVSAAAPRYSTPDTAYVPLPDTEWRSAESAPAVVLAVQIYMELPTPCLPFHFYSNVSSEVGVIRGDLNHRYSDEDMDVVDALLNATRHFCIENKYIGMHWSCPGALATSVKKAHDAFMAGIAVPNNVYTLHLVE